MSSFTICNSLHCCCLCHPATDLSGKSVVAPRPRPSYSFWGTVSVFSFYVSYLGWAKPPSSPGAAPDPSRPCSLAGSWSAPTLSSPDWKVLRKLWTLRFLSRKQAYLKPRRDWNLCLLFSPREYAGGANSFLFPTVLNHTHRFVKWIWFLELESPSAYSHL